ncbi:hypothetical protein QN414_22975, partial [Pseudomonas sp. 5S1]
MAKIIGISLCATECGVVACSINSCGHMANQFSGPSPVGAAEGCDLLMLGFFISKDSSLRQL